MAAENTTPRKSKPTRKLDETVIRNLLETLEKERITGTIAYEDALVAQRLGQGKIMAELEPFTASKRQAETELAEWDLRAKPLVTAKQLSQQEFDEIRRDYLKEIADADAGYKPALEKAQKEEMQLFERARTLQNDLTKKADAWSMWTRYADAAGVDYTSFWTPEKGPVPRPTPQPTPVPEDAHEHDEETPAPAEAPVEAPPAA